MRAAEARGVRVVDGVGQPRHADVDGADAQDAAPVDVLGPRARRAEHRSWLDRPVQHDRARDALDTPARNSSHGRRPATPVTSASVTRTVPVAVVNVVSSTLVPGR